MKEILFFVTFAIAASGLFASTFESSPSCTARLRAGDGPNSKHRIWQGISPLVKKWELGKRDEAFKNLKDILGETFLDNDADKKILEKKIVFEKYALEIDVTLYLPDSAREHGKVPVMLFFNESEMGFPFIDVSSHFVPTNMITTRGYAYVSWKFNNGKMNANARAMFSACVWGNRQVMDWIKNQPMLDSTRVAIIGHGQGGKVALLTGAQDERFAMVASMAFAFDDKEPFKKADDLLRLIAPRLLYVGDESSAVLDIYKAYKIQDRVGFHSCENAYLTSADWEKILDFADINLKGPLIFDSDQIDKRIEAACKDGSRLVTLGRNALSHDGVWRLSRAILLPDDFTLVLDGCRVELLDRVQDNIIRNIGATEGACKTNRNIRIIGRNGAILSGGKRNHYLPRRSGDPNGWRSVGILLCDVVGYEVGGFSMEETQCWAISQERCSHGYLHDIHFNSSNAMFNQDGIDLRKGCHDIKIENIYGQTGDDTVALTALRDAPGVKSFAGMQIGGNSYLGEADDIYNVTIRNIYTKCSGGHSIVRLLCADGIKIHHIFIENIVETVKGNVKRSKSVIRMGDAHYSRFRPCAMGEMHDIHVKNVTSAGGAAVFVNGPISDSTFIGVTNSLSAKAYEIKAPTQRVVFK